MAIKPNCGLNIGPSLVHCKTYESAHRVSGRNGCQRTRPVPITHICCSALWNFNLKVWNSSDPLSLRVIWSKHMQHMEKKKQSRKKKAFYVHVLGFPYLCLSVAASWESVPCISVHLCICVRVISYKHLDWKIVEMWVSLAQRKCGIIHPPGEKYVGNICHLETLSSFSTSAAIKALSLTEQHGHQALCIIKAHTIIRDIKVWIQTACHAAQHSVQLYFPESHHLMILRRLVYWAVAWFPPVSWPFEVKNKLRQHHCLWYGLHRTCITRVGGKLDTMVERCLTLRTH